MDIVDVLFLEEGLHASLVEAVLAVVVGLVMLHSYLRVRERSTLYNLVRSAMSSFEAA